MKPAALASGICAAALIALIFLGLAWELWLKVLPLLAPLFGVLRGRAYTYQWSSMLILAYFTEGVVRAWSDRGLSAQLAMVETALTVIFFIAAVAYIRTQPRKHAKTD